MTLHRDSARKLAAILGRQKNMKSFRFVFLGDSRGENEQQYLSPVFQTALKKAALYNPLFIVHGGDTVYKGSSEQLQAFKRTVKTTVPNIPVFVTLGNHDLLHGSAANFRNIIGTVHWYIRIPNLLTIIALNNSISSSKWGFTKSELANMQQRLSRTTGNTMLAMHAPPAIGRWTHGFSLGLRPFLQTVASHKNVSTILVSHIHAFDTMNIEGRRYVLSGGAGAPLSNGDYNYVGHHIVVFTVTKDQVTFQKVNI